jgi:hypothetical protein
MGRAHVEVVVEGPRGRARGFVEGYLTGRGVGARLLDAEEEGFGRDTLREQLREFLHPRAEVLHLLVPAEALDPVREAVDAAASAGVPVAIRRVLQVVGASFEFSFSAFSREHGRRLVSLVESLPREVRVLRDAPFEERVDPTARGIEAYSPVHEYEIRGKGTVEGDFEGVLAVRRRMCEESAIHLHRAELIAIEP